MIIIFRAWNDMELQDLDLIEKVFPFMVGGANDEKSNFPLKLFCSRVSPKAAETYVANVELYLINDC